MVRLARSADGARSFARPLTLDDANPVGRVALATLDDGTLLCAWITQGDKKAYLVVRGVSIDGRLSETHRVAEISPARTGGFPTMVSLGDSAALAWKRAEGAAQVLLVKISVD